MVVEREKLIVATRALIQEEVPEGTSAEVEEIVVDVLSLLPKEVKSLRMVTKKCKKAADEAISENKDREDIDPSALRAQICCLIRLTVKAEWLEEMKGHFLTHCEANPVPNKWGLGSIANWKSANGKVWGASFVIFWRRNIEKKGDTLFKEQILPHFPEEWQNTYKMRDKCPIPWKKLYESKKYGEIVGHLSNLSGKTDLSEKRWGLGSIANWKSADGEAWGASFLRFWRNHIETEGDILFREHILLHLPEDWQMNYKMLAKCLIPWKELYEAKDYGRIAGHLSNLSGKTDPSQKRWGLGSIANWENVNGEAWGHRFLGFWRRSVEKEGDTLFRKHILPHLPEDWQINYKMLDFEISFSSKEPLNQEEVDEINDLDELQALAEAHGSQAAFNRCFALAAELFSDLPHPSIERAIHLCVPSRSLKVTLSFRTMYHRSYGGSPIARKNIPEYADRNHAAASSTDHEEEKLLDALTGLNMEPDTIFQVIELLNTGHSLEDIQEEGSTHPIELQEAARQINEALF